MLMRLGLVRNFQHKSDSLRGEELGRTNTWLETDYIYWPPSKDGLFQKVWYDTCQNVYIQEICTASSKKDTVAPNSKKMPAIISP